MAVLGAHTLMTGLLGGVPTEPAKIATAVTKALGLTSNDWSDYERMAYEKAVDNFGKEGAEYLMHGVARQLAGVDVHHRLGLNSFFTFGLPVKHDDKTWKAFLFDQAMGAPEGLAADTFAGIHQMLGGDIAGGAAKALPSQALRDVMRAWGGGTKDYKYSAGETAARVLGFTPTGEAEQGERVADMRQLRGEYTDHRNALIQAWVQGSSKGEAWTRIQKFNSTLPPDARITMAQLHAAAQRKNTTEKSSKSHLGMTFNKQNAFIADRDRALYQ
jgi:hypothetical protein